MLKRWRKSSQPPEAEVDDIADDDIVSLLAYKKSIRIVGMCPCGIRHNPADREVRQATLDDIFSWFDRKELWDYVGQALQDRYFYEIQHD